MDAALMVAAAVTVHCERVMEPAPLLPRTAAAATVTPLLTTKEVVAGVVMVPDKDSPVAGPTVKMLAAITEVVSETVAVAALVTVPISEPEVTVIPAAALPPA